VPETVTLKENGLRILETTEEALRLEIDGRVLSLPREKLSRRLASSPQVARETIEITPTGYGLHRPLVDADPSVDGILRDFG
jgi:CRP-like cAMP-binding protein